MSVLTMDDAEWLECKTQLKAKLKTIMIPLDVTPGITKGLLARIDSFFTDVRLEIGEVQAVKERTESLIREWEREKTEGKNEMDRKRNATVALQNYPIGNNETINMYDYHRQVVERYSVLQSILETLQAKQSRLITVTGVLKLEKELTGAQEIGGA